jgi:hypothetical protein
MAIASTPSFNDNPNHHLYLHHSDYLDVVLVTWYLSPSSMKAT